MQLVRRTLKMQFRASALGTLGAPCSNSVCAGKQVFTKIRGNPSLNSKQKGRRSAPFSSGECGNRRNFSKTISVSRTGTTCAPSPGRTSCAPRCGSRGSGSRPSSARRADPARSSSKPWRCRDARHLQGFDELRAGSARRAEEGRLPDPRLPHRGAQEVRPGEGAQVVPVLETLIVLLKLRRLPHSPDEKGADRRPFCLLFSDGLPRIFVKTCLPAQTELEHGAPSVPNALARNCIFSVRRTSCITRVRVSPCRSILRRYICLLRWSQACSGPCCCCSASRKTFQP